MTRKTTQFSTYLLGSCLALRETMRSFLVLAGLALALAASRESLNLEILDGLHQRAAPTVAHSVMLGEQLATTMQGKHGHSPHSHTPFGDTRRRRFGDSRRRSGDAGRHFGDNHKFTRWGHSQCPGSTRKLYQGIAKGPHYQHNGGSNTVCVPDGEHLENPTGSSTGDQNGNLLYSIEYENTGSVDKNHDKEAVCVVCASVAPTYVSWGRNICGPGASTTLYQGYVMADHYTHGKSNYVCVDQERQTHARSNSGNQNGGLWYTTEAETGSLPGSRYTHDMEITCAVCKRPDTEVQKEVYTRWGHRSCPSGSATMYSGFAAGSHYTHGGSGANTVCLHQTPIMTGSSGNQNGALLYGTEYENTGAIDKNHDGDAACTVCLSPTPVDIAWGRNDCNSNGVASTKLYSGVVMATHYSQAKSESVCVDMDRQTHGYSSRANHNGNLWYTTEVESGSSNSNSHSHNHEVACAVCRVADNKAATYKSTYTRWGHRSCPSGTATLRTGWMAGSHYQHGGGGYNSVCMANDGQRPSGSSSGDHNGNLLYGTEYENTGAIDKNHDSDAACAVCATTGAGAFVTFGRNECMNGHEMRKEYSGFAMSKHYTQSAGETVCVDSDRQTHVTSSTGNSNGNLLYTTEFEGNHNYNVADKEVACVVCSIVKK